MKSEGCGLGGGDGRMKNMKASEITDANVLLAMMGFAGTVKNAVAGAPIVLTVISILFLGLWTYQFLYEGRSNRRLDRRVQVVPFAVLCASAAFWLRG